MAITSCVGILCSQHILEGVTIKIIATELVGVPLVLLSSSKWGRSLAWVCLLRELSWRLVSRQTKGTPPLETNPRVPLLFQPPHGMSRLGPCPWELLTWEQREESAAFLRIDQPFKGRERFCLQLEAFLGFPWLIGFTAVQANLTELFGPV